MIRIGKINYTNVWPIYHFFPHERFGSSLEWIEQVPTGLNRAMMNGEVDMGAFSSFAYAQNYERYELFPNLSVSALGSVHSILLFHKNRWRNWTELSSVCRQLQQRPSIC